MLPLKVAKKSRTKVAFSLTTWISQLLRGSLLIPFADKSDAGLWEVLRKVYLHDTVAAWGKGLDYEVTEKGDNFSVGQ
ncbi:hypothetical protein PC113_g22348 [Phytophthora cactorum]|uniref:Uncharacterized protein n=1 Tax=Phytophthora cactorum TaxID=29920 RepID=A0A8T1AK87_9STRA|nr:hypothetical protein PC111_g22094 [Phytophthora cactorum]KAG2822346.1 hypothetical protein PC113_g22348 [Phytophthora cactorum]KAG2875633.1 hypothetical protein PC114_g24612 [Phytophthora cactorum]KAG2881319.1 hypothetical protein PC115_g22262 [Phytophthora cactorum]KAG2888889.1 hypothetical protein PC117_g24809 [Phytophthora cactorum]